MADDADPASSIDRASAPSDETGADLDLTTTPRVEATNEVTDVPNLPDAVADVEDAALPAESGLGRRIVFSESRQRVWLVDAASQVVRTYLVSGSVYDNLDPGTFRVYSRSEAAVGIDDSGTMMYFVRFTTGRPGRRDRLPRHPDRRGRAGAERRRARHPAVARLHPPAATGRDRAVALRADRDDCRRHGLTSVPWWNRTRHPVPVPDPHRAAGPRPSSRGPRPRRTRRTPRSPGAVVASPRRHRRARPGPADQACGVPLVEPAPERRRRRRLRLPERSPEPWPEAEAFGAWSPLVAFGAPSPTFSPLRVRVRLRSRPRGRSPSRGRRSERSRGSTGAGSTMRPFVPGGMPWSW